MYDKIHYKLKKKKEKKIYPLQNENYLIIFSDYKNDAFLLE